jgi:prepilin-type N-terminal cleavage/methylation domain-containing protein
LTRSPWCRDRGFTLIEVIGALVIFSLGVLMVMQVSGALGTQMRYAGASSAIHVVAASQLDSLEALPLSSLMAGTAVDTIVAEGIDYECTVVISTVTSALKKIDISLTPISGSGPSHSVTSYASEPW